MNAVVFSGQGSQYVGMAADLIRCFPEAATLAQKANDVVGYDLVSICTDGPAEVLKETRYTQPALFLHEAIILTVTGVHQNAVAVAGHSLGEFTALYAAGVLTFEDALRIVALRARLMFDAGNELPGTMAAIVGLDDERVTTLCSELDSPDGERIVPANFNAPGQVVVSGSVDLVRSSFPRFKEAGAKLVKELAVSGAFHSPLLKGAQRPLSEALDKTTFRDATKDVYVNVTGEAVRNAAELRNAAQQQIISAVRWTETIKNMEKAGVTHIVEVGPGTVLQGLMKRIAPTLATSGLDTAEHVIAYRAEI